MYWNGTYVSQSFAESVWWDQFATNQGNVAAMVSLAECNVKGLGGLEQNANEGLFQLMVAAEKGDEQAANMLKRKQ